MIRAEIAYGELSRAQAAATKVRRVITSRIGAIQKKQKCSFAQALVMLSRDERDMYLFARDVLALSSQ
jgi:hypothetical protein